MKLEPEASQLDAGEAHERPEAASDPARDDGIPENVRRVLDGAEERAVHSPTEAAAPTEAPPRAFGNLALGRVTLVKDDGVDVMIGSEIVEARAYGALQKPVLLTAQRTGEPVLVQQHPDGTFEVMGSLRTQATPGVDEMKEVTIEADRVEIRGRKEVLLTTSGLAAIALRAAGEVETYADRIVSRAEELHKIVGRMLRLN